MSVPSDLPELQDLIPLLHGNIFYIHDDLYFQPENLMDAIAASNRDNSTGLVRVGFKVYEVIEWVDSRKLYKVRPFYCNLTQAELHALANGKPRPKRRHEQ